MTYEPCENTKIPIIQRHLFFLWVWQNDHHTVVMNKKIWEELSESPMPFSIFVARYMLVLLNGLHRRVWHYGQNLVCIKFEKSFFLKIYFIFSIFESFWCTGIYIYIYYFDAYMNEKYFEMQFSLHSQIACSESF
jgi:hypothetical protein